MSDTSATTTVSACVTIIIMVLTSGSVAQSCTDDVGICTSIAELGLCVFRSVYDQCKISCMHEDCTTTTEMPTTTTMISTTTELINPCNKSGSLVTEGTFWWEPAEISGYLSSGSSSKNCHVKECVGGTWHQKSVDCVFCTYSGVKLAAGTCLPPYTVCSPPANYSGEGAWTNQTTPCDGCPYDDGTLVVQGTLWGETSQISYPGPHKAGNCNVKECRQGSWHQKPTTCVFCENWGIKFPVGTAIGNVTANPGPCYKTVCEPPASYSGQGSWANVTQACI